LNLIELLYEAKIASLQQIKRIKRNCPEARGIYMKGFNGRYLLAGIGIENLIWMLMIYTVSKNENQRMAL